jgi:hypothetical protein
VWEVRNRLWTETCSGLSQRMEEKQTREQVLSKGFSTIDCDNSGPLRAGCNWPPVFGEILI